VNYFSKTQEFTWQERSIKFAGEIPEGAMVNLTCGDKTSILEAAGAAAKEAREHRVISVQFGAELCPTFGGKEEGGTAFL
jgi:hypothetical protein